MSSPFTKQSILATSLLALTLPVATAYADVAPGDVITTANVEKIKDLASPGMMWIVRSGMPMKIVPPKSISKPPPFMEATEQYSAQVKLSEDGLKLENWVAGLPFPTIDPNDKDVAKKIMYNYQARWGETDDLDLRNFDADTGAIGRGGDMMTVERHFLLDHFKRMFFIGRLFLDPKPEYAPNNDQVHYKESLHPIIEPFDLKGTGFTYYRYLDHNRHDDSWLYLPQLRRVRRLSSAQRSDALFGQDTDVDSYGGYAGNIAWMDWKFLGDTTLLAAMHGEHFPVKWGTGSGDFMFEDVWEKRDVWIVEGYSKLPQYAYSKRVIFVDKEAGVIPYTDIYDQAGQLWKIWVNLYKFGKKPFEGAPEEGTYAWEQPFLPAIVMVDIQLQHATRAALPSAKFPGEIGWRYNKGAASGTTEDFFSISHLISSGR